MASILLPDTGTDIREDSDVELIPRYKIIFLNDDLTTMDFVVKTLIMVFKKDKMTAVRLMLEDSHVEFIPRYKIIFLNDDLTTMDFVVKTLIMVKSSFKKIIL